MSHADALSLTHEPLRPLSLSVVAAVNDDGILAHNLLRSQILQDGTAALHRYRDCPSAAMAYNLGIDEVDSDIIAFAHQDVYLPRTWWADLCKVIGQLSRVDPDWAILGAVGVVKGGSVVGRSWSSGIGRTIGSSVPAPVEVVCIDEMLIVMRRDCGLRFDPALPGFHLYGSDIVLSARAAGLRSYVVDMPIVHNSRPVRDLGGAYARSHSFMRRKWSEQVPVETLIVPLTPSVWPLLRARLRLAWSLNRRLSSAVDPHTDPRDLARQAGFDG